MGIDQSRVSKIERQTDVYVSTLRNFVSALGGELELVARFPDGTVTISSLFDPPGFQSDIFSFPTKERLTRRRDVAVLAFARFDKLPVPGGKRRSASTFLIKYC